MTLWTKSQVRIEKDKFRRKAKSKENQLDKRKLKMENDNLQRKFKN